MGYTKENDVEITDIVLESRLGSKFSLLGDPLFEELHILESLDENSLTGEIHMYDGANFIGHFPIIGQEFLHITFRTPLEDSQDFITHTFYVYAVSPRQRTPVESGGQVERYILYFASPELIENSHLKCHKSYNGTSSLIVSKIMKDNFPKTPIIIEDTNNMFRFISPYWNPFQCIQHLAERSTASAGGNRNESNFIFYQTLGPDGGVYNFKSVSSLAEQNSVQTYHLSQGDGQQIGSQKELLSSNFTAIKNYQNEKYFDKWEGIQTGKFASTLFTHDITYKNFINTTNFSYITDFYSAGHVNQNKVLPPNNDMLSEMSNSVIHYKPRQDHLYFSGDIETKEQKIEKSIDAVGGQRVWNSLSLKEKDAVIKKITGGIPPDVDNFKYEDWYLNRKSLIEQMYSQKNKILVSGDTRINAGDVVTLNIPTIEARKESDNDIRDLNVGGRFLITAIRHYIDAREGLSHTMWLELSRDSLPESIPDKSIFLADES